MRASVCNHILKVSEHKILQTACGNFTKFTTLLQLGTEISLLDFEVKGLNVKVTVGPNKV